MTSPNEFRDFARECMEAAEKSSDPTFKQKMVEMAKLWMSATLETERDRSNVRTPE